MCQPDIRKVFIPAPCYVHSPVGLHLMIMFRFHCCRVLPYFRTAIRIKWNSHSTMENWCTMNKHMYVTEWTNNSINQPIIHSFIYSFIYSFIHSFIHSLTHSFTQLINQSTNQSFIQSINQSINYFGCSYYELTADIREDLR